MQQALELAARGLGHTHPNPMVGALLVRRGEVVGEGWHRRLGGPHAEVFALRQAGDQARGATMYVTLEPCAHFGRTPPCVDAIREAGVRRVVIGSKDPNPKVAGRGMQALRRAGVRIENQVLSEEARALNIGYFQAQSTGLPWVTLKLASSLDGKLAPASRRGWLTGSPAVKEAHRLRAHHDAVLVGGGTARLDDPQLTVRAAQGADPLRVVVSASLDLPMRGRLFRKPLAEGTVIGTVRPVRGVRDWEARRAAIEKRGVEVWVMPGKGSRVPLRPLLKRIAKTGAYHVLAEGGGELAGSLLSARLADELQLFFAPMILGEGVGWATGAQFEAGMASLVHGGHLEPVGEDWLLTGRLEYGVHRNRSGNRSRP